MDWAEAVDLCLILRADPSSMLAAAMEGWEHPISREALVLMDLFDLEHAVNSGKRKPKPHPGRPFRSDDGVRHGKPRPMSEVVEILNRFGHNIPV